MQYRVVQGSYGRYEDGILKTYRARTDHDIVELDADTATRLGAQVEALPEVAHPPATPTPALPLTPPKRKKDGDEKKDEAVA